ncbi:hypothetical protein MRX96_046509, partial [Rhipicephalus microplus]
MVTMDVVAQRVVDDGAVHCILNDENPASGDVYATRSTNTEFGSFHAFQHAFRFFLTFNDALLNQPPPSQTPCSSHRAVYRIVSDVTTPLSSNGGHATEWRPVVAFLASVAAAVGTLALAVLLVRKICVVLAREVLLTEERASYTVRLEKRVSVSYDVRLLRFALKSPPPVIASTFQKLGFRVGEHVLLYARIGDRTVMRPYTPVSRVDRRGSFDIMVKIYPAGVSRKYPNGGLMSQYLDSLKPGDKIQ